MLKADVSDDGEGWSDSRIIEALDTSVSMVYRVRKQLVEEGLEAVLSRKAPAAPAVPRIFDGEKEARLIAPACSKPPEGYARWSLRLLESKVVEFGIVEAASDSTIQRVLKKTALQPHRRKYWVIPPKASGAFVAAMEDVLLFYTNGRAIRTARWFVWTRPPSSSSPKRARRWRCGRGFRPASITNTPATG